MPRASHSYGSPTIAVQQYPARRSSLKTVHRTVFLTLRPSRVQVLIKKKEPHFCDSFLLAGAEGLAACFALLWLADRCRATVPGSPLLAKNSPQDCFLNAQTLSGSSPYRKKEPHSCDSFLLAGAEGLEPSARGFGDHCSTN